DWAPAIPGAWPVATLLGHVLECLAGFCAVLIAVEPEGLSHFAELRTFPVNHNCTPQEAQRRIAIYCAHIEKGMALIEDADLGQRVPTIFVQKGEPLLTLLLGNLEHLINHKHQLFTYLKLMRLNVNSRDLYHFRGE